MHYYKTERRVDGDLAWLHLVSSAHRTDAIHPKRGTAAMDDINVLPHFMGTAMHDDSTAYVKQGFTFTPATSIYVLCESEEEIDRLFEQLSQGGPVFMPLDRYPFSDKFAWLSDRFGESWQLNWAEFSFNLKEMV